jgi:glycosyltransferase involved in cell wall biosynthesis
MRVLFVAGRELTYTRNEVLLRAFRRFSEVDQIGVTRRPKSVLVNSGRVLLKAAPRLLARSYDLIYIGFYGHLLVLPLRLLSKQKILFDAFISTYDTLVGDRQRIPASSLTGKAAYWLDRRACQHSTHVLLDTPQQIDYFVQSFDLGMNLFSAVPVGCNEDLFYPRPPARQAKDMRVLFYCSYLPLHGADIVVWAAKLLEGSGVCFRMIGNGQTFNHVNDLAKNLKLSNLEFVPPVPLEAVPEEIASADICLGGPFGRSEKADRVIPGKVYQVLAMRKPLIAARTAANLQLLKHGRTSFLCNPNDPHDLARAVRQLAEDADKRDSLAGAGFELYKERCSEEVITAQLRQIVAGLGAG